MNRAHAASRAAQGSPGLRLRQGLSSGVQRGSAGAARGARAAVIACMLSFAGFAASAGAVDWTGRVSLLGSAADPRPGDVGDNARGRPTTDQQSLRLMAQGQDDDAEWSLHLIAGRQQRRGLAASGGAAGAQASAPFRWRRLADDRISGDGQNRSTVISWEIDRAVYKRRFERATLALGRQPVDFGSGRFWQPLNVFGAFAPTALDTDHKPGIDALRLDAYPSAFSSLTLVHAFAPRGQRAIGDSTALHHRRQVGESSQAALLLSRVIGQQQFGGAFESDWRGLGWRFEALHTRPDGGGPGSLFWILGADHRFDNGLLAAVEWHDDARGATSEAGLAAVAASRPVALGLQQQLARRVLGLSLRRELGPLWNASFTVLASALRAADGGHAPSLLQQFSLLRSLGNESDLLLSLVLASGAGLGPGGQPRSSFGHLPATLSLRWRTYF